MDVFRVSATILQGPATASSNAPAGRLHVLSSRFYPKKNYLGSVKALPTTYPRFAIIDSRRTVADTVIFVSKLSEKLLLLLLLFIIMDNFSISGGDLSVPGLARVETARHLPPCDRHADHSGRRQILATPR
jgi:hypothetical protein